ncbi:DUF1697 domain-containing protein [Herbidospora yilanensis]|uniref:DUF1697 domain-containing protein n=1 Tax=Herbidospora yilanensis TaxID=354426 RepID=UPI000A006898|nr:DUF1697 domain-containing protein [Herbidospora yilanensis]
MLLRAVNLGGHKNISMPDLRAVCTDLGYADVEIYLQNGRRDGRELRMNGSAHGYLFEGTSPASQLARGGLPEPPPLGQPSESHERQ